MNPTILSTRSWQLMGRTLLATLGAVILVPGARVALAQDSTKVPMANPPDATAAASKDTTKDAPPLTPDQLESLVAPIALYPDDLLAQCLVASTYPLEIVQLQQWMAKNPGLKDKALADSVAKQPWDPSIQSMAAIPDVVKRLADDVQWTTELGNAFLANQAAVMDAVQRMRKKAKDKGALASNEQQKVSTDTVEQKTVIVVQSTNPEVIYVPVYSPAVVYPPPIYPYPPIYYPPYPPGAAMVSFTVGMMWGAAIWGGSCCHAGWGGGNTVIINNNNNFNRVNHNGGAGGVGGAGGAGGVGGVGGVGGAGGRPSAGTQPAGGGKWQHNPSHRGAAPYGDKGTSNKYGGAGAGNRPSAGTQPAGGGRPGAGGAGTRPSAGTQPAGGGGNRGAGVGTQPTAGGRSGGFSGGSGGYSGANARASSSRGAASRGGGMSRGGGGGRRR